MIRKPKLVVRQKTLENNKENDKLIQNNDNFAKRQKLHLMLKMIVRQQKLNMEEIY